MWYPHRDVEDPVHHNKVRYNTIPYLPIVSAVRLNVRYVYNTNGQLRIILLCGYLVCNKKMYLCVHYYTITTIYLGAVIVVNVKRWYFKKFLRMLAMLRPFTSDWGMSWGKRFFGLITHIWPTCGHANDRGVDSVGLNIFPRRGKLKSAG